MIKVSYMNNNVSEFGKEVGLLHEMAITGRKVGAGVTTYSFLASNELWLGRFSNLSRHLSVVVKNKITTNKVDCKAVGKLAQDITVIAGCCVTCGIANGEHRERALPLFVSQDIIEGHKKEVAKATNETELNTLDRAFHEKLYGYFYEWLEAKLSGLGIHPAEVAEFFPQYEYSDNRPWGTYPNKGWFVSKNECSDPEHLTGAIELIARQRNVLGVLESL